MLHQDFTYLGQNNLDCVIINDEDGFSSTSIYAKELIPQTYIYNNILDSCPDEIRKAKCIKFRGKSIDKLPEWISECKFLEYIAFYGNIAETLTLNMLPDKIKTLELYGNGNYIIPDNYFHNYIDRIISTEGTLLFDPSSFQSLIHVHIKCDRKKKLFNDVIKNLKNLKSLTISPCSSFEDINELSKFEINYLRLVSGLCSSISGIENFKMLTNIHIHDLTKLENIKPLVALDKLQEISIGYCNKIKDIEIISAIKNLKKLQFYGCQKLPIKKYRDNFYNMNLDEIMLGI